MTRGLARALGLVAFSVVTACARTQVAGAPIPALALQDDVQIVELATGASLTPAALQARLAAADFVLLGEQHDNVAHHRVRAALLAAVGRQRAAVVFEHFARGPVIPPPAGGKVTTDWLTAYGFDLAGWAWPIHEALVTSAVVNARSMRGSNVTREELRAVVRGGAANAPADVRALVEANPLEGAGRATLDAELVASHCGQLPPAMVGGMRDAQVIRDAAMATAMRDARADGTPWLLAGNGHVRSDNAVPRLLRTMVPNANIVVVGFVERDATGAAPALPPASMYGIAVITAGVVRTDPCASFRAPK